MWLNNNQAPGRAIAIYHSSPKTRCHLSTATCFSVWGMADRISQKRFYQCEASDSIILTMPITHPRRTCQVDQVQPPSYIFLRDRTFFSQTRHRCSGVGTPFPVSGTRYAGHGTVYGQIPGLGPKSCQQRHQHRPWDLSCGI